MPYYHYRALQPDDVVVEGDILANVPQEVYRQMELHGLLPISVSLPHSRPVEPLEPAPDRCAAELTASPQV